MFYKNMIAFVCCYILASSLHAIEDIPPCFKDLETDFFKYEYTAQAFSMHRIGQSQWASLVGQLQSVSEQIPELVRAQGKQVNPNPLERPFQSEVAVVLLKRALYIAFKSVMDKNYLSEVSNEIAIKEMFEHIWGAQRKNMRACLGEAAFASERITE